MSYTGVRKPLAVLFTLFFALGIFVAGLGPNVAGFARQAQSSLEAVGGVFSALFIGSFLAQVVAGPLIDRVSPQPIVLVGMLLLGAGMLGLTLSWSLALLLTCAVVAGLGHGTLLVTANVLMARLAPAKSAVLLNLLNGCFGLGAVIGPAIAGYTLKASGSAFPALWAGIAVLIVTLPGVRVLGLHRPAARSSAVAPAAISYRTPVLWFMGGMLFIYVGLEVSVGGWTATYIEQTTTASAAQAALVASGFWLALTIGRVLGALIGTRLAPSMLLLVSVIGSLLGGIMLVASPGSATGSIVAILLLGIGFGPVFPTVAALTMARFPHASGTAMSAIVAGGNIGGIFLPSLVGVLLARQGPAASALLIFAGTALMLLLHAGERLVTQRRTIAGDTRAC